MLFKHILLSSILANNRVIFYKLNIFMLIFDYNYNKIVLLITISSITIIIFPSLILVTGDDTTPSNEQNDVIVVCIQVYYGSGKVLH